MNSEYQKIIFDIETDNLLDNVTKIHCLSYCNTKEGVVKSLTDYEDIKKFFLKEKTNERGHCPRKTAKCVLDWKWPRAAVLQQV